MNKKLVKNFEKLAKQAPYKITGKKFLKRTISLDELELCDVPSEIADEILSLLNGAYLEGVSKSFSAMDFDLSQEKYKK
jgi:hypothetical protein